MPGISRIERQAFKKSFKRYAYIESTTPVPIALWVFDFPKPFGSIDCEFDARKCTGTVRSALDRWLLQEDGKIKNALHFFVLDGSILKAQKLFGINPKAVGLFHDTIRKQLNTNYSAEDYFRYQQAMFQYSSEELMRLGTVFKHTKKRAP
jgi:hypothetical protein